ncbi:MAG: serine acetyltransferase [Clostridiaceae bacterium]|jgi:serine O-acetyltransferase|nr:serine acetyltransferase [Clostridiaceae bacterium]
MAEEWKHWNSHLKIGMNESTFFMLSQLLLNYKEYRNLIRIRFSQKRNLPIKILSEIFLLSFPRRKDLFLNTANIGKNLIIQHGFSTGVSAKSIGDNCWINQQVIIGYSFASEPPVIGNGVIICAGAKVIGDVFIDDNAIVGANAVVVHDVGKNEIVGGVPAKRIGTNHEHILYHQ